ncbi:acetyl esterase/lipase [Sphingomonas insulae]|uniref:BD-FAE-like domain-containing protein n=1 Tax=Sphingomonas insulae TaxID=424800 RepID=A0ABN1HNQ6_9SPHN|nr:alpha/beta hydrolase [Sphingomonas insulae]NIJ30816.1 acetyl esterase/lipase [Sphingomonas insulae]
MMSVVRQLLRTGLLTVTWLVLLPCLLLLCSVIVPIVPWLRIQAVELVPNRATWFLLLGGAGLAIGWVAHRRHRSWVTRMLIGIALATVSCAGLIVGRFVALAHANGVAIDWVASLSNRHFSADAAPDETHVYAAPDGEPLLLDIYRAGPTAQIPRGTALSPVLVVVHGGGFTGGDRRISAANMRRYARSGWAVISIDYRLARPGRPTWNLAIADVHCALAWTVAHAPALRLDLNRVAMNGASAGGSLAIAAAYTADTAHADRRCGPRLPRIAAVTARVPLIDPAGSWNNPGEMQAVQRAYMAAYIGGSPRQFPERYAALDLRRLLRPSNPPTLILAGIEDPLLPIAAVRDFTRLAQAKSAPVRLVAFPYSGHDFNTTYHSLTNQIITGIVPRFLTRATQEASNSRKPLPR